MQIFIYSEFQLRDIIVRNSSCSRLGIVESHCFPQAWAGRLAAQTGIRHRAASGRLFGALKIAARAISRIAESHFKDFFHGDPFAGARRGFRRTFLEGSHEFLPFADPRRRVPVALAGGCGIIVVEGLEDHEQPVAETIDPGIKDASLAKTEKDFRPDRRMAAVILGDDLRIASEAAGEGEFFHFLPVINH